MPPKGAAIFYGGAEEWNRKDGSSPQDGAKKCLVDTSLGRGRFRAHPDAFRRNVDGGA